MRYTIEALRSDAKLPQPANDAEWNEFWSAKAEIQRQDAKRVSRADGASEDYTPGSILRAAVERHDRAAARAWMRNKAESPRMMLEDGKSLQDVVDAHDAAAATAWKRT